MINDHIRPLRMPIAFLLIIGLFALIGIALGLFGSLAFFLFFAIISFLTIAYRLPELPLVVLVMGMGIWTLLPPPFSTMLDGIAIPFTLSFVLLAFLVQQGKDNSNKHVVVLFPIERTDLWFTLLTIWVWLSLLWTNDSEYGQFKALGFTAFSFVAYIVVRWAYYRVGINLHRLAILIVLAGLGHAILVLYASILSRTWRPDVLAREFIVNIRDMGLNFISEADALSLGLLATMLLIFRYRRYRILLLLAYFFQLWALMRFQQRGAVLALLVGTLFIFLTFSRNSQFKLAHHFRFRNFILILPVFLLLTYLIYAYNPQLQADYLINDTNVTTRFDFYRLGIELFRQNPLYGVGIGGAGSALSSVLGTVGTERFYVHNRIIEIMAELGMVGTLLFVILTFSLFKRLFSTAFGSSDIDIHFGIVLAGSCLLARYTVGMSSGDIVGWNIGLWAGLIVGLHQQWRQNLKSDTRNSSSLLS